MSIIPASLDLSGAEIELVDQPRREFRLRDGSRQSRQTMNIFYRLPAFPHLPDAHAAGRRGAVIVPLQCEFYALED